MTNPVFFEDPRMLTEARLIYLNHTLPGALGSGDVDAVALQLRARLTERLSLIATKDGFIMYGSDVPVADDALLIECGLAMIVKLAYQSSKY